MTEVHVSQEALLTARKAQPDAKASQMMGLIAYGPPAAHSGRNSQDEVLIAYSGTKNVSAVVTQMPLLYAYKDTEPASSRQTAWTFVMDGHRFYVLPLGPEGDWAYDTITHEWCQLQSNGYDGLNFKNGVMWGLRVMGGDTLYTFLYELDPEQPLDEAWREITRVVTGGIATRGRSSVGVANFSVTASVADVTKTDQPISLAFSDDNGVTWSAEFPLPLTDQSSQRLIWNSLGSFSQPGRVFRITDTSGPVRLDGADVVLTIGTGADSGIEQEGQHPV